MASVDLFKPHKARFVVDHSIVSPFKISIKQESINPLSSFGIKADVAYRDIVYLNLFVCGLGPNTFSTKLIEYFIQSLPSTESAVGLLALL